MATSSPDVLITRHVPYRVIQTDSHAWSVDVIILEHKDQESKRFNAKLVVEPEDSVFVTVIDRPIYKNDEYDYKLSVTKSKTVTNGSTSYVPTLMTTTFECFITKSELLRLLPQIR